MKPAGGQPKRGRSPREPKPQMGPGIDPRDHRVFDYIREHTRVIPIGKLSPELQRIAGETQVGNSFKSGGFTYVKIPGAVRCRPSRIDKEKILKGMQE